MKKKNYIIALIGILLFSCKDPYADDTFIEPEFLPAAARMKESANTPGDYQMGLWGQMIEQAGLYQVLNYMEAGGYTCFVPLNGAVSEYLSANGYSSVQSVPRDVAELLVKYHTIPEVTREQSTFAQGLISEFTASGDRLNVTFGEGGIVGGIKLNDEATLQDFNIEVTNGIIHTMNKVLTPITATVWDRVNTSGYSIFAEAAQMTEVDDILQTVVGTEDERYFYTLFAVPNSVYSAAGISSVSALVAELGAGADYTSESNALNQYMKYHVIEGQLSYSDLSIFGEDANQEPLTVNNLNSMYPQGIVSISLVGEELQINSNTRLTQININSKNGMMHVVNTIMPVEAPITTAFKYEFTQYPELGRLIPEWRTGPTRNSNFTRTLAQNEVECYTWYPSSAIVQYYSTSKGGTNYNTYLQSALFYDIFQIRLGLNGWIEMEIPTFAAGTYKISLVHANRGQNNPGGRLTFVIDDNITLGTVATRGNSSADTWATTQIIEGITFGTTQSHKLKIIGSESVTSEIDYLLFEPVL